MSEFMFGVGRGELTSTAYRKIDKIAGRHGATVTNPRLPGTGWKFWFSAPNRGNPFDRQTSDAVFADLRAAGLANDDGLIDKCFAK